jgi:cation transport regulator
MPYSGDVDLPDAIRRRLPAHAQDIYRRAFNSAFAAHAGIRAGREPPTGSPGPR